MERKDFVLDDIPTMLLGNESEKIFLYIHGLNGDGSGAIRFAEVASKFGYQVLRVKLPRGEIRPEILAPKLQSIMKFLESRSKSISIRANSFGAWLSLISFRDKKIDRCLYVSPLLNMENFILMMMNRESISEEILKREGEIDSKFGVTISWKYLEFVRKNPVRPISSDTRILHCTGDEIIPLDESKKFAMENSCELEIIDGGEHWFHTDSQIKLLEAWESKNLQN